MRRFRTIARQVDDVIGGNADIGGTGEPFPACRFSADPVTTPVHAKPILDFRYG